jgi:hypothetical protein
MMSSQTPLSNSTDFTHKLTGPQAYTAFGFGWSEAVLIQWCIKSTTVMLVAGIDSIVSAHEKFIYYREVTQLAGQ